MPTVKFTEVESKIIQSCARLIFDQIAGDLLELNEGKPLKRRDIIEVVCDAGRLEEEIRREGRQQSRKIRDPESAVTAQYYDDLAKKVDTAGTDVYPVVKLAFPFALYS